MKKILILLLFITTFLSNAQNKKFSISVGPEFRITPVYLESQEDSSYPTVNTNTDPHLSGAALTYMIKYSPKKIKWNFGMGQSFRYDLLHYENSILIEGEYQQHEAVKTLMIDYHFDVEKYFNLKNDYQLKIVVGASLMDRGTDFATTTIENEGTPYEMAWFDTLDYKFTGYNLGIGLEKNGILANLGIYYTDNTQFEDKEEQIIIPYIQLQYKVFKF
jgi:hypothetical protein